MACLLPGLLPGVAVALPGHVLLDPAWFDGDRRRVPMAERPHHPCVVSGRTMRPGAIVGSSFRAWYSSRIVRASLRLP